MADKKKAAKEVKSKTSPQKGKAYEAKGEGIERKKPVCPKCGPGVFMGTHKDRTSCGKCGYTEFKK